MTLTERPELIKELQALSLCYNRGYFLNLQGDQRKHACKKILSYSLMRKKPDSTIVKKIIS